MEKKIFFKRLELKFDDNGNALRTYNEDLLKFEAAQVMEVEFTKIKLVSRTVSEGQLILMFEENVLPFGGGMA